MQRNNSHSIYSLVFRDKFIAALSGIVLALSLMPCIASARHQNVKKPKHPRICTFYYDPQNELGGISGRIMGNLFPVSGAVVVLMRNEKLIDRTTTDEDGRFIFRYTDPGNYNIIASKESYHTSVITDIPVTADHTTRNDFYLPKFNSRQVPADAVSEPYSVNRKFMKEN